MNKHCCRGGDAPLGAIPPPAGYNIVVHTWAGAGVDFPPHRRPYDGAEAKADAMYGVPTAGAATAPLQESAIPAKRGSDILTNA